MSDQTTAGRVLARIRRWGRGAVFTPKDFLDLGGRATIGSTLSRLATRQEIRRIGRGLYHYPRFNERLGIEVAPHPNHVADAIARQTGAQATPSGAMAANQLGLTTQVPARLIYLTNGDNRTVKVGKQTYVLKGVVPKDFKAELSPASLLLRALKYMGKEAVDERTIGRLQELLSDRDRRDLERQSAYMTDWLRTVARRIANDKGASFE